MKGARPCLLFQPAASFLNGMTVTRTPLKGLRSDAHSQVHHRVSHYSLRFPHLLTRAQQVHQLRHDIIPLCENNWRGPGRADVNASLLLFCGAPLRHNPVDVFSRRDLRVIYERGICPHVWESQTSGRDSFSQATSVRKS